MDGEDFYGQVVAVNSPLVNVRVQLLDRLWRPSKSGKNEKARLRRRASGVELATEEEVLTWPSRSNWSHRSIPLRG